MRIAFLSYATTDHHFAELAALKLADSEIQLWRDQGQLRAGSDWRLGIEKGISECLAVLVALSPHSAQSSYVTYEWAYAMGQGKPVIPMKLAECSIHPKLEAIQYLDRLRKRVDETLTDDRFRELIAKYPGLIGPALLEGKQQGLKKLIP